MIRAIFMLSLVLSPLFLTAKDSPKWKERDFLTVRLQDNGKALLNPGMGWTMFFYSNLTRRYGAHLEPSDTLDWFEGCSTVYMRVPWAFLEPEEGKYQWSILDTPAQRWISKGKKVALRFTTSEGWLEYATPKWVEKAGAKLFRYTYRNNGPVPMKAMDPIYDDPVYLAKLRNFLKAAGTRYNGNPNIAFVDIGTFGLWGEGHTFLSQRLSQKETERLARIHIDMHKEFFPDTQLVISDDVIGPNAPGADFPLMRYCRERGISMRDDSILVSGGKKAWHHADLARTFYPVLPVIVEHEHYGHPRRGGWWENGRMLQRVVEEYHVSYLSIHAYPEMFWKENMDVIRAINRRVGYRFVIPEVTFPEILFPGTAFEIRCKVGNAGVAPPYRDAFLTYTLTDDRGGIVAVLSDETLNLRELPVGAPDKTPLKTHVSRLKISDRAPFLKPGLYTLWISVGRRDGTPEIRLPYDKNDAQYRVFLGTVEVRKGAFGCLFEEG